MAVRATVNAAQLAADPILLQTLQYSIAKSILSSYSGEFDWLAEVLQNSVDSLQRRWKGASAGNGVTWTVGADPSILPDDLVPRLRVIVYRGEDAVVVVDNGTGMGLQDFASLAVPFATDKGEARERGQKGVGLKYLIYGHNAFALASKIAGIRDDGDPFSPDSRELHEDELRLQQEAVAAGMSNDLFGVASAGSTRSVINAVDLPLVSAAPPFPALDLSARLTPCLAQVESGVAVEIGLDAESEHGRLSRRFFSSNLSRWQHVLRTKTAVGHVDIDQDLQRLANVPITRAPDNAWLDRLVVEIFVVEGSRVAPTAISYEHIRPEFEYPHTLVPPAVVERCRNLRGSNTTAQYEALYEHWTEPEFAGEFDGYLRDRIASLGGNPDDATADEHLADPTIVDELREIRQVQAQLTSLAPSVYAVYGWHNRYWEQRSSRRVASVDERSGAQRSPDDTRGSVRIGFEPSIGGGLLVAGSGMPMANRLPHPIEILPQDNDRLFVLVSVGGTLRLDLGRKVPHATEHAAFLREVDTFVYKQFLWNSRLLLKRNLLQRGQTPQGFDVQQQLASVYAKVRSLETQTSGSS